MSLFLFYGERNGNPLQYSCLENPIDGEAWEASQWSHKESDMTEQLHAIGEEAGVQRFTGRVHGGVGI